MMLTNSRNRVLASSLGVSLQKTDRILSGSQKLMLDANIATDQSLTMGDKITLGLKDLNLSAPRDVTVAMGYNYHELSHYLFSPRLLKTDLMISDPNTGMDINLASAWNYLEESRVETLFAAMYGKSKFYFTVTFSHAAMKSQWDSVGNVGASNTRGTISDKEKFSALSMHLLAHGRAYLPANVRKAIRDGAFSYFPMQSDQDRIMDAEKIIDTYRTLTMKELSEEKTVTGKHRNARFPRYIIAALKLHTLFPELFNSENTNGNCQDTTAPYGAPPRQKNREEQERDEEKEQSASEQAEQDKRDDYEEVELPQGGGQEDEEDEDEETPQEGQEGSGDDSGDEGTEDDESESEGSSEGDGDASEGDAETDSGNGDDGSGDGGDSEDGEESEGESSGASSGGESDGEPQEQGVGGNAGEDIPLTREEQKELLASVIAQIVDNSAVSEEIDRIVSDVEAGGEQSADADNYIARTIPESQSDHEVIAEVSRVFEGLREQVAPGWNYGADNGRLNVNRAMQGVDPEEMYDEWDEGREDDASVELVILLDMSNSMSGPRIWSASALTHILRRSLSEVDAHVSVYGFSDAGKLIVLKGRDDSEQDNDVPIYKVIRSTEAHAALNRAREVFAESDCANRVLITITDGVWENDSSGVSIHGAATGNGRYTPDANYRDALANMGAHKVLCFIDRKEATSGWARKQFSEFVEDLTSLFDTAFDCHDPRDLAAPLTEVVASVVQNSVS